MLFTNELGCKAAERQALARMADEFLGAGRKIHQIETPEPEPLPLRRDWIDPETILHRKRTVATVLCAKPARPARTEPPTEDEIRELLIEYAAKGYSIRAAADAIGIGEKLAQSRVKRHNIAFRVYQTSKPDAQVIAEAREHVAAGRSVRQMLPMIGVSRERLLRLGKSAGIEFERNRP